MNSTLPIEQRLIKAIRILTPDKQRAVLDFAEFLQNRQSPETETPQTEQSTTLSESDEAVYGTVDLAERGINPEQAADLRSRLQTFAEDWNRPEMAVYDEL